MAGERVIDAVSYTHLDVYKRQMFNKAWYEVMERDRLSHDRMIEYIEKQSNLLGEDLYKKYFITGDDDYGTETLAVKMSRKFVKGYEEELRKEKQKKARRHL